MTFTRAGKKPAVDRAPRRWQDRSADRSDRRTGAWVLLEVNARPWGSMPLPLGLGVDFPWLWYRLLTAGEESPAVGYRAGVFGRNLLPDLQAVLAEERGHGKGRLSRLACWLLELGRVATGREIHDVLVRDETGELGSVLRKSIEPDLRTAMVAPQIGFVHRRAGELDLYFIVNTSNLPYDNAIELRVPPHPAEWWDAMTGELTVAPPLSSTATSTKVRLALPPYASKILVFGMPGRGRPMKSATRNTDEPLARSRASRSAPLKTVVRMAAFRRLTIPARSTKRCMFFS